jgi:hypothetical protein
MEPPSQRRWQADEHHGAGCSVYFCGCALVGEAAMARRLLPISVKLGLSDGSADQHCSINALHWGSQDSGTGGRSVLFTIPPA